MSIRSNTGLIGLIYNNKITLALIVVLFSLIKQNIFTNNFPNIVLSKQKEITDIQLQNNTLEDENISLKKTINSFKEKDLSLIESTARFKYGLIKEGEFFYKINKAEQTDNLESISKPAL